MELILLTSILTLTNIVGVEAVTGNFPRSGTDTRDQYSVTERVAESESNQADSLVGAVKKFKKEKGWI